MLEIYSSLSHKTKYQEIKDILLKNQSVLESTKEYLRSINEMTIYKDQSIDCNFKTLMQLNDLDSDFRAVCVPSDGNCFYNALSSFYFGSAEYFYVFKICAIYVCIENEEIIKDYLLTSAAYSLKDYLTSIEKSVRKNEWADFINIVTSVILLKKSISIITLSKENLPSKMVYGVSNQSINLLIGFYQNHFVPIFKTNEQTVEPLNAVITIFDDFKRFPVYINNFKRLIVYCI